jgi:formate transporter FocA
MAGNQFSIDALVPQEMARKAEQIGVAKVNLGPLRIVDLAILAGVFIALGAIFATTVTTGGGALPFGVTKLLGGFVFCLGLVLVLGAGTELFTGNNLIVMAWADRKISSWQVIENWSLVYVGNFVGALLVAVLLFLSEQWTFAGGSVGLNALNIANAKVQLDFVPAIFLGIFCNALVCLAVWLGIGARTATDKILAVLFPITAFVAAGFEHCVANMYFIPIGLLIKNFAPAEFWQQVGVTAADYSSLTWSNFFLANLLPVTIGNIIGGAMMVGLAYWFIYLRPSWTGHPAMKSEEE